MSRTSPDEESIFKAALTLPSPEAKRQFLEQACGGDKALQARVQALLHVAEEETGFLAVPALETAAVASGSAEGPGAVIGPYKLLEQLGEGGFGVVYLAEQTMPVRRKVALKVLKHGMHTRQVVARFEAERQALAIMDHPNIARVFDGGVTPSGRPFFVMELVKGVPITEFCDLHKLTPRQRLELFVDVCQAVQHAHQKGIIHRDIKPSNVLVSRHDTTPVVKVIDFGVAKALGQELTDKTLFTGIAQMIGTPLYMSPEQAGMSDLDVDTRSDVYSLGVLLYELLTGATPFSKERFKQAAYDEIRRIIREEDPPKPSTRISESTETLPSVAANRSVEPRRLGGLMRGELDWIVMKALEKDRNRRYETANGFSMDVQRYLAGEVVQACPPSAVYRIKKFVRRHRASVLSASLVFLALVGGVVGATWGLLHATQAAEAERLAKIDADKQKEDAVQSAVVAKAKEAEANAVIKFFQDRVFAAARPKGEEGGLGKDVTLRVAIAASLPALDTAFGEQPLVEARLRSTLGNTFLRLGETVAAEAQLARARAIYTAQLGPDHPDTLYSVNNLASCYPTLKRHAEALKLYEETLAAMKRVLPADDRDTLICMQNLANLYTDLKKFDKAIELHQETLASRKRLLRKDHPHTLLSMYGLARAYSHANKDDDAVKLFEETLAAQKRTLGDEHPHTLSTMHGLALCYSRLGRPDDVLRLQEEVLAARKKVLPSDNRETLSAMQNLAGTYSRLGRHEDALKLYKESLAGRIRVYSADHMDTLADRASVAESLVKLGRGAEALPILEEGMKRAAGKPEASRFITRLMELRLKHFQNANDPVGCRATAELVEKLNDRDPWIMKVAARCRAVAAAVQTKVGGPDAAKLAQGDADKAMAWLQKAFAAAHWTDGTHLRKDAALEVLRERDDFKKLLEKMEDGKKK